MLLFLAEWTSLCLRRNETYFTEVDSKQVYALVGFVQEDAVSVGGAD